MPLPQIINTGTVYITFPQENPTMDQHIQDIIARLEALDLRAAQSAGKDDLILSMVQEMRTQMQALMAQGHGASAEELAALDASLQKVEATVLADAAKEDAILNTLGTPLTPTT